MSLPEQHTYVSNICGIDLYFLCLKSQWDPPKPSKCSNPAIICARCNKVTTQNSKTRDLGYPFGGIFTIQLVSDLITLIYRPDRTDNGRVGNCPPPPLLSAGSDDSEPSWHSSSWKIFSSARDLFTSARMQNRPKTSRKLAENEPKFEDLSLINFDNKLD